MNLFLHMAEVGGDHPPPLLDPHGFGLVFWTGIIFALVGLALYKLAWGPVLQALQDREAAITGAIDEAQGIRTDAERVKAEWETRLESHRQEGEAIINEAESDAKGIRERAQAQAVKDADEIKARAERDIVLAKNKALAEVRDQARELGMVIAEKVIQAEVDAAKHKSIVDQVVATYERG